MPKQSIDEQIRARIEVFVDELSTLVREAAVEAVGEALHQGPGTASKRAGRKSAPKATRRKSAVKKPGKRVRRTADDIARTSETVLAYVKSHPGARMEQMAKALRKESKDLRRSVQDLIAARKLRTKGQKRATAYYAGAARPIARKKPVRAAKKKTARKAKKKTRSMAA